MPHRRYVPISLLLALLPVAGARADTTRTVRVDCSRGESINAALRHVADRLVVEISGKCREAVVVSRANVVLRGTDPAVDGLIGPVGDFVSLLEIQGAAGLATTTGGGGVALENLSLAGGAYCGLFADDANVSLRNCLIADNNTGGGCGGAHFARGSAGRIVNTTFLRNHLFAADSSISCRNCTFAEHPFGAFLVSGGAGHGTLVSSTITGGAGASAVLQGRLHILDSTIDVTQRAISVEQGGQARVIGGTLSGQLVGDYGGLVRLAGTTQSANAFGNQFDHGTFLAVDGGALAGMTRFDRFSHGTFANGAALGALLCSTGADAVCDGSVTKASSSCGLCP